MEQGGILMKYQISLYEGETGERHTYRELHIKSLQKPWGCVLNPRGGKEGQQVTRTGDPFIAKRESSCTHWS